MSLIPLRVPIGAASRTRAHPAERAPVGRSTVLTMLRVGTGARTRPAQGVLRRVAGWASACLDLPRVRQFGAWLVLGFLAFGAELGLLVILHQQLRWPLWLASALAAESVLLARFASTDRFVFGFAHPSFGRCGRFHAAAAGAFTISWLVLNGSASLLGVSYVAATFLGSAAAFVWSALTNFLWVWRHSSGRADPPIHRVTAFERVRQQVDGWSGFKLACDQARRCRLVYATASSRPEEPDRVFGLVEAPGAPAQSEPTAPGYQLSHRPRGDSG